MKKVILSVMPGSLEIGFPVMLEIKSDANVKPITRLTGKLPPNPHLSLLLQEWQSTYTCLITPQYRLGASTVQITNISYDEIGERFALECNNWLSSDLKEWQKIKNKIQDNLDQSDEIAFIIETDEAQLHQIPWHLWNLLLNKYSKAEVIFSIPEYQQTSNLKLTSSKYLNVLAILGNSAGINTAQDRALLLKKLSHAKIDFLVEPERKVLNDKLWSQGWDILFFAGHSGSKNTTSGQIWINQTDTLTISEVKYALTTAVRHGLKLAIFNSCDGIGLAREMLSVGVPHIIVMREPVPDRVAQEFLKYFLPAFAKGKSIYLAVKEAREKLQGLENIYPYASWLPIIFQASTEAPLTWERLNTDRSDRLFNGRNLGKLLLTSTIVTFIVLGLRYLGLLQAWELKTFDQLLLLRPEEKPDERILVVTVTEADIKAQSKKRGSLSDAALEQLLKKLEQHQARVIGLDIYRDFPVEPGRNQLATNMRQSDRLIAVCKASDKQFDPNGVAPPPEVPQERLGFSDMVIDSDKVVRRQLLAGTPEPLSVCSTPYAFSTQVAFHFLATKGILPTYTPDGILKLGSVVFKPLSARGGGYQNIDAWGYQVLLNYRYARSPQDIAAQVTLTDILKEKVNPNAIENRIVLIGTTANSFGDFWNTPYTTHSSQAQSIPGVLIQAQMISQIVSAVLDNRSLLWVYPFWIEVAWIFGSAFSGGMLVWWLKSPLYQGLAFVGGEFCLTGIGFGLLVYSGCWMPFVPSAISLAVTASSVIIYRQFWKKADL